MTHPVELGRVAQIFNGKTPAKTDQRAKGHPVLKIRDIDDDGRFRGSHESFVEPHFAQQFRDRMVRQGDTLILNAAHNADYVASKLTLAAADVEGSLATGEWLIVRPTAADARFVHYWLQSMATRHSLRDLVKGIHLYPKDVARLLIPVSSRDEQRRIADVLDKADAIRRKRKEAITLTGELLRAAFLEMFGDPVTNPKGWPRDTIGNLLTLKSGDFLPAKQMDLNGPYAVYGGNGINGRHSSYMFEDPVITIGRVGVYCGVVHRTEPRSWVTDNALYVANHSNGLIAVYLEHALRLANLNQYASQAAQPLISSGRLAPVPLVVPPKALQDRFAKVVDAHEVVSSSVRKGLAESETLFDGLVAQSFSRSLEAAC